MCRNLSLAEIRAASRAMREAGYTLPAVGWIKDIPPEAREPLREMHGAVYRPKALVHEPFGYFYIFE